MKSLTTVFFLVVSLCVVVGCGDDSDDSNTSNNANNSSRVDTVAALTGDAQAGTSTYDSVCTTCHAPDGSGIDGLGNDLTDSTLSRLEIIDTVLNGRGDMVGYSNLEDQAIADVTAYTLELRE